MDRGAWGLLAILLFCPLRAADDARFSGPGLAAPQPAAAFTTRPLARPDALEALDRLRRHAGPDFDALFGPSGRPSAVFGFEYAVDDPSGSALEAPAAQPGGDARSPAERRARAFLNAHRGLLGPAGDELALEAVYRAEPGAASAPGGGGIEAVRFRQMRGGLPVLQGAAVVHLDFRGAARSLLSSLLEGGLFDGTLENGIAPPAARVGESEAIELARQKVGALPGSAVHSARLGIARVEGRDHVVWDLRLRARAVPWRVLVDASTGEVLAAGDLRRTADCTGVPPPKGLAFTPSPAQGPWKLLELPDLDCRSLQLSGSFLRAHHWTGEDPNTFDPLFMIVNLGTTPNGPDGGVLFDKPDPLSLAQCNVYYHGTLLHAYFKGLGFDDLDRPFPAVANAKSCYGTEPCENAFYDPLYPYGGETGLILFGGNPKANFAHDGDVVYHEYTHAVVQGTAALGDDFFDPDWHFSAALNEAFADYFSSTVAGDALLAEYSGRGLGELAIRNLANGAHWPEDVDGWDPHTTGLIWSGALWSIRQALSGGGVDRGGIDRVDRLAYATLISLETTSDLLEAAAACVAAASATGMSPVEVTTVKDILGRRGLVASGGTDPLVLEELSPGSEATGAIGAVVTGTFRMAGVQYRVTVPDDGIELTVELEGVVGAQNLDLYVRYNGTVGTQGGTITATYRSEGAGASETLRIGEKSSPPLTPGTYFVAIANRGGTVAGYKVRPTIRQGTPVRLEPLAIGGFISSTLAGSGLGPIQYSIEMPASARRRLEVRAVANGEIELLLRHGQPVELGNDGILKADAIIRDPPTGPTAKLDELTVPPLRSGTYYAALRNRSAAQVSFTIGAALSDGPAAAIEETALAFGETRSDTARAAPPGLGLLHPREVSFIVPSDGAQITVSLKTAGDLGLYLRREGPVDLATGQLSFDHSSNSSGAGDESIAVDLFSLPPLLPGKYFAAVVSYGSVDAPFDLRAVTSTAIPEGTVKAITSGASSAGRAESSAGAPGGKLGAVQYRLTAGAQAGGLDALLTPEAPGDLDLFVRRGRPVQMIGANVVADFRGATTRGVETITVLKRDLAAGDYYFAVLNHADQDIPYQLVVSAEAEPLSVLAAGGTEYTGNIGAAPAGGCSLGPVQYVVDVPATASRLEVSVEPLDGGPLGILQREGARVVADQGAFVSDRQWSTADGAVVITGGDLRPGLLFFALSNCVSSAQRYRLRAFVEDPATPLAALRNAVPYSGLAPAGPPGTLELHATQYTIEVPPGSGELRVAAWGADCSTADVDLLVGRGERVTATAEGATNALWRAHRTGSGGETIAIGAASKPPLEPGLYYIAVANREMGPVEFQVGAAVLPAPAAPLVSGAVQQAQAESSGIAGVGALHSVQYRLEVFPGAEGIAVDLLGTGDVDLYLRYGLPVAFDVAGKVLADHESSTPASGSERLVLPLPGGPAECLRAGSYFLAVGNFGPTAVDFSIGAQVIGTRAIPASLGETVDGSQEAAPAGQTRPPEVQIVLTVPPGTAGFQVDLVAEETGADANLDLFVRQGEPVEFGAPIKATFRAEDPGPIEWLTVPASKTTPGKYYVAVASRASRRVSFTVHFRQLFESSKDLAFFTPLRGTAPSSSGLGVAWLGPEQILLRVPSGLPDCWVKLDTDDPSSPLELHLRRGKRVEGDGRGVISDRSAGGTGDVKAVRVISPAAGDYYLAVRNFRTRAEPFRIEAGTGSWALRGDVDESGAIDLTDPISIIQHLFLSGPPGCGFAADADDTASLDLTDPIYLLGYLFLAGPAPRPPFPNCGPAVSQVPGDCTGAGCP